MANALTRRERQNFRQALNNRRSALGIERLLDDLADGGGVEVGTLATIQNLSPNVGDLGFPSDAEHTLVCLTAGVWSYYLDGQKVTPSSVSDWSIELYPGGEPTLWTTEDRGGRLVLLAADSGEASAGLYRALPSAPYVLDFAVDWKLQATSYNAVGIHLRDSASGNEKRWALAEYGTGAFGTSRVWNVDSNWDIVGSVLMTYPNTLLNIHGAVKKFRVVDTGSVRQYLLSWDNITFIEIYTEANTAHVVPNQVGLVVNTITGTTENTATSLVLNSYETS